MFKLLHISQRAAGLLTIRPCLKDKSSINFSNYRDFGEYDFLDKYNYVGNYGIHWAHPQSPFIIRITDDYDRCVTGNRLIEELTCWWYFPKQVLAIVDNEFSERDIFDIENELRNWKLIQSAPKDYFEWSVGVTRCQAVFPNVHKEQKYFGAKHFISTIYTDDVIEKLNSHRQFSDAADELIKNLRLIFSGTFDQITDMNKFSGRHNIPDLYIREATRILEMNVELGQLAKQLLKPKVYDLYVLGCQDYLNGVAAEKTLFNAHCPTKTVITERDGKNVRLKSIGLKWILPTMMTDESTAIHLNHQNPAVDLVTWTALLENDISGYYKDKIVDFSPMSFCQSETSDLQAAKYTASRANEAKKAIEYIWQIVPEENAKHYEYLAKYMGVLLDYNFVRRLRNGNNRYGWIPRLDK